MHVDRMITILEYRGKKRNSQAIITEVTNKFVRVLELRDNVVQYRTFQLAHLNYVLA